MTDTPKPEPAATLDDPDTQAPAQGIRAETEPGESSALQSDPALLLLLRLKEELSGVIPPVLVGDAEALHRFRIVSRRLRLLLGLVAKAGQRKRIRRARRTLRTMERASGRTRDLWVVLNGLDAARPPAAPDARRHEGELRRRLVASIRGSQRAMVAGLLDTDIAGLRADLRRIGQGKVALLTLALTELRRRAQKEGVAFLELAPQTGGRRMDVDALHQLRRRVRLLRYLAEIDVELTGEESGAARRFKAIQDLLGEIRDQWLLREWARAMAERAERAHPAGLAACARALAREAQAGLRAGFATWQTESEAGRLSRALRRMGAPLPPAQEPAP